MTMAIGIACFLGGVLLGIIGTFTIATIVAGRDERRYVKEG